MRWLAFKFVDGSDLCTLQLYTWNINEAATLSAELDLLKGDWHPRHEKACIIQENHAMYCCFGIMLFPATSLNTKEYAFMIQLHNTDLRLIKQVDVDVCSWSGYLNLFEATTGWLPKVVANAGDIVQYTWKGPYCIRTVIRRNETGRSVIGFETRILHV